LRIFGVRGWALTQEAVPKGRPQFH
jgi:hypothetical protein